MEGPERDDDRKESVILCVSVYGDIAEDSGPAGKDLYLKT
jgi:hypothetical protein